MKISVRTLTTPQGNRWQVNLDQHGVTFRSQEEAQTFVRTLERRLKAPHQLPQLAERA
ncbi:MAG TPA: hypothetical protein VLC30_07585 [Pseudomonas sp.]|nr:hypothetical protein [Pseudomonas sp.]